MTNKVLFFFFSTLLFTAQASTISSGFSNTYKYEMQKKTTSTEKNKETKTTQINSNTEKFNSPNTPS